LRKSRKLLGGHADAAPAGPGDDRVMITSPKARPTLDDLTVGDVMHAGVFTCAEDAALETAASMMATYSIHCVVVLEGPDDEKPWGVVSDLDLVSAALDRDACEWKAGQAAASPAVTIGVDEPLRRAAQLMREYGIAHLVVVDADSNTPLGVISTLDLARTIAN
jgi:CBS domain-containing protein